MEIVGIHCVLELHDCPKKLLEDTAFVANSLREASRHGLSTLLEEVTHKFHPGGTTALGLLAESHISIHTWPEFHYCAADVFTCGQNAEPDRACAYLVRRFCAGRHSLLKIARGDCPLTSQIGTINRLEQTDTDRSLLPTTSEEASPCPVPKLAQTSG